MATFLELTQPGGKPIFVNADMILWMERGRTKEQTLLTFGRDHLEIYVTEMPEVIADGVLLDLEKTDA